MPPSRAGEKLEAGISKPLIASSSSRGMKARGRDLQVPVSANWLHLTMMVGAQKRAEILHHPCILGGPQQREQNQKSKPTPGVTLMHHATKRGFKDCPGFLNSTGQLGPKRGRKCYITLHSRGSPTKGTKSEVKTYAGGHPDAPRNKAWIQRLSLPPRGSPPPQSGGQNQKRAHKWAR